jgi:hypothetical protein
MASSGRQPAAITLWLMFASLVLSQNVTVTDESQSIDAHHVDAVSIIFCLVLLLTGGTLATYGFRWFRFTLFVTGFIIVADLSLTVLLLVLPPTKENASMAGVVYLLTLLVGGLVGGTLVFCLKKRGLSLIGVMGAFTLARLVRCAFPLLQVWVHIVLLVVLVVGGVVANRYVQRPTVVLSTSLTGAFIMMMGVDLIVASGLVFRNVQRDANGDIYVSTGTWLEMGGIAVITVLTSMFQFWKHPGQFGDSEPEKVRYQGTQNPVVF